MRFNDQATKYTWLRVQIPKGEEPSRVHIDRITVEDIMSDTVCLAVEKKKMESYLHPVPHGKTRQDSHRDIHRFGITVIRNMEGT